MSDETAASPIADGAPVRHDGSPPVPEPDLSAVPFGMVIEAEDLDEKAAKRSERLVAAMFGLSVVGSIGFVVAYFWNDTSEFHVTQNVLLAITLTLALLGLGLALILWAKQLMPHEQAIQERHDLASSPQDRQDAADILVGGANATGIGRRKLLLRSGGAAAALLGVPIIVTFRDLGFWTGSTPANELETTAWKAGMKLIDPDSHQPVTLSEMDFGAIRTVMPEGFEHMTEEELSLVPTILVRIRPDELVPVPGRENWSINGYIAYSKICTHAGCPISLYEQQTHHLLCPCHQSTFQLNNGAKVIFGPAARAMPQLPIAADAQGVLFAQSGYSEPVGPSFWERG